MPYLDFSSLLLTFLSCPSAGAGGWLGGVLATELLKDPKTPNVNLILCDIVEPKPPKDLDPSRFVAIKADLSKPDAVEALFNTKLGKPTVSPLRTPP